MFWRSSRIARKQSSLLTRGRDFERGRPDSEDTGITDRVRYRLADEEKRHASANSYADTSSEKPRLVKLHGVQYVGYFYSDFP